MYEVDYNMCMHCSTFSKALEQYKDRPEKVGECFLKFVSHTTSMSVAF